ncbi:MAG: AAA family ATPase [Proteobacteria bacterium]|nr:AAA family ATPase [Pseudomonadota bacterium]
MRYLTSEIIRFLAEEPKMAFIAGPRQVGKTTLAKHLLAQAEMEAFYFNWDKEGDRILFLPILAGGLDQFGVRSSEFGENRTREEFF